eukprot:COSAG06_NODE_416_length_15996_cov_260.778637_7_plen_263_part_00
MSAPARHSTAARELATAAAAAVQQRGLSGAGSIRRMAAACSRSLTTRDGCGCTQSGRTSLLDATIVRRRKQQQQRQPHAHLCLRLPACACLRLPAPGACRVCLRLPAPACAWRLPCLRACFKFDSSSHTHHHVACALRVCLLMVYVLYTPLVLVLVLCMRRPDQEQPTWVPFHRPVSGRQRMHLQCERWYRGCECLQGWGTRDERQGQLLAQPAQWHDYCASWLVLVLALVLVLVLVARGLSAEGNRCKLARVSAKWTDRGS